VDQEGELVGGGGVEAREGERVAGGVPPEVGRVGAVADGFEGDGDFAGEGAGPLGEHFALFGMGESGGVGPDEGGLGLFAEGVGAGIEPAGGVLTGAEVGGFGGGETVGFAEGDEVEFVAGDLGAAADGEESFAVGEGAGPMEGGVDGELGEIFEGGAAAGGDAVEVFPDGALVEVDREAGGVVLEAGGACVEVVAEVCADEGGTGGAAEGIGVEFLQGPSTIPGEGTGGGNLGYLGVPGEGGGGEGGIVEELADVGHAGGAGFEEVGLRGGGS
jgi:hypothetical protein